MFYLGIFFAISAFGNALVFLRKGARASFFATIVSAGLAAYLITAY